MNNLIPQPLKIIDIYQDGKDALHLKFQIVDDSISALENPYFDEVFPGQFFMLSVPGVGEAPFTYVSRPDAVGCFYSLVRNVGVLTDALTRCEPGDILGYRGPYGKGWPSLETSESIDKTIVIAGGCGLAPLAWWLEAHAEHSNSLALLCGAKERHYQVLGRELENLKHKIPVFEVFDKGEPKDIVGNPLNKLQHVISLWGETPTQALLCGPEPMMFSLAKKLCYNGMTASNIWLSMERRMHCGVGTCGHCYIGNHYICQNGPVYQWSELMTVFEKTAHFSKPAITVTPC